tara:strand:+ start:327 stop:1097 length:771 start_codon:yes stop_codon:yes gene_type:complete
MFWSSSKEPKKEVQKKEKSSGEGHYEYIVIDYEIEYKSKFFNPSEETWVSAEDPVDKGEFPYLNIEDSNDFIVKAVYSDIKNKNIKKENNDFDKAENRSFVCYIYYSSPPFEKTIYDKLQIFQMDKDDDDKELKDFDRNKINKLKTIKANTWESKIVSILKSKKTKLTAKDIHHHLGLYSELDLIKEMCEDLFRDNEISRTDNYRYFVKTKEKKLSESKSKKVDIKSELKKMQDLLDEELITQDDYDKKKKELLGL